MRWYFLLPAGSFLIVLFTSLRFRALGAAAAGMAAGYAALTSLGILTAARPGLLVVVLVTFGAMAFAEAVAASIFEGGGLGGALALALAAHGALFYLVFVDLGDQGGRAPLAIFLIPPALLGGTAAALGARLARRA